MADKADNTFSSFLWKSRVLVLTGEKSNEYFKDQLDALQKNTKGLNEREMVTISVNENEVKFLEELSLFPPDAPNYDSFMPTEKDIQYFEKYFDQSISEFSVLLIGKDGGVKKVWNEVEKLPVKVQEIFEIIDSMPMRQQEMRDKN